MTSKHNSYHLPRQIIALVLIGVLFFTGCSFYTFKQVAQRLDANAALNSKNRVQDGLEYLQTHVRLFSKDYNNWSDIHAAVSNSNVEFIANNYGITANQGDIFDIALMFGGPLKRPLSWVKNGSRIPGGKLFSDSILNYAAMALAAQDQDRPSVDFIVSEGESVILITAAYLLPDIDQILPRDTIETSAVALIGRHLLSRDLTVIEQDASVSNLHITRLPESGFISIPVLDITGQNSLHLAWKAPRPGSALVGQLAPVIAIVTIAFVALSILACWLVYKNARQLVQREQEANELARIDILTGLPNRLSFHEEIHNSSENVAEELAFVMIDLDRFKQANDVFGHAVGDYILRSFSDRLRVCADKNTFISRVGGDEFCAIFRGSGATKRAQAFLAVLDVRCSKPMQVRSESVNLIFSAGIATHNPSDHIEETLRKADIALRRGKSALEERVGIYDADMDLADKSAHLLEQALRSALGKPDEFHVVYQPIISSNGGETMRVEALARWTSPILGPVSPDRFIGVAEQAGLIWELGWIIIDKVLADLTTVQSICACINVSPLQIMKPSFLPDFLLRLNRTGVEAKRIQIELTENVMVRDQQIILERIKGIRSAGIRVALDDFGTGFSAISYLTSTEFDSIKIDKSLLRAASESESSKDLFISVVSLSRSVCADVVVEGIETSEQAQIAISTNANAFQGYYYGTPAPFRIACGLQYPVESVNMIGGYFPSLKIAVL